METGLFEIQADLIEKQARKIHPTSQELVYTLFGRTKAGHVGDVGDGSASHDVANKAEAGPSSMGNVLAAATNADLRGAFCVLPICPITRSIALAAMKQSFGARSGKS